MLFFTVNLKIHLTDSRVQIIRQPTTTLFFSALGEAAYSGSYEGSCKGTSFNNVVILPWSVRLAFSGGFLVLAPLCLLIRQTQMGGYKFMFIHGRRCAWFVHLKILIAPYTFTGDQCEMCCSFRSSICPEIGCSCLCDREHCTYLQ